MTGYMVTASGASLVEFLICTHRTATWIGKLVSGDEITAGAIVRGEDEESFLEAARTLNRLSGHEGGTGLLTIRDPVSMDLVVGPETS